MPLNAESAVKQRYAAAAQAPEACLCSPVDYEQTYLGVIPPEVIQKDYGCGKPNHGAGPEYPTGTAVGVPKKTVQPTPGLGRDCAANHTTTATSHLSEAPPQSCVLSSLIVGYRVFGYRFSNLVVGEMLIVRPNAVAGHVESIS